MSGCLVKRIRRCVITTDRVVSSEAMKRSDLVQQPKKATNLPAAFGTGLIALDVILDAASPRELVMAAGGTCGNVLAILSYLGWATFPVARLNGDAASEIVRADLKRWGVSLDFSSQTPTTATPIIVQTIRRDRHGSPVHRFSLVCPVCGAWFPPFRAITRTAAYELIAALAATEPSDFEPRVFYFDRVSRGALILAEAFAARGAVIVFEPASVSDAKLFDEALSAAHILKYSHERLPNLAERQPAGRTLFLEIETRGSEGLRYRSSLLQSQAWLTLPAVRAPQVVDTAGAGDWCTAGLLSQLAVTGMSGLADARPCDLAVGLRFGQAAAAIACGYVGARGAMYSLPESRFAQATATLLAAESAPDLKRADQLARNLSIESAEHCRDPKQSAQDHRVGVRRVASSSLRQITVSAVCSSCG
jgi:sugar/nucleoside kinase (ribokinase family)